MGIIAEKPNNNYILNLNFTDIENLLIKNLPTKTRAGSHKAILTGKKYPSYWAVQNCKFIEYNSPKSVSITILDFDKISNNENIKDRYPSIYLFNKYFLSEYLEVNFIVETHRGYQAFIVWNSRINKDFWKSWNLLQHIKKGFLNIPYIDTVASARNKGVFRNPLKHKTEIYRLEPFSLYDFKDHYADNGPKKEIKANIEPIKHRKTTNKEIIVNKQVKQFVKSVLCDEFQEIPKGFRKASLFQIAMIKAKKMNIEKDLYDYLFFINKKYCLVPLKVEELENIVKSVIKYKRENKLFVKNPLEYKEKTRKEINADYWKKHKGEKTMTRKENLTKINKARAEAKKRSILNIITGMFKDDYKKKNGKWHIKRIAEALNFSEKTVKKYLSEIEELQKV